MSFKKIIEENVEELSGYFAQILMGGVSLTNQKFNLALSGGSTPKIIFKYLANNHKTKIEWNKINYFWGDERCVPPDNHESNYKSARDYLFSPLDIVERNIFRIKGENNPDQEAIAYSHVVAANLPLVNSLPQFDLIMLGLGEDGHTASIFPGNLDSFTSKNICDVAVHPLTKQKRITLTGSVINNAKKIVFIVTGQSKSKVVDMILNHKPGYEKLPASHVNTDEGDLIWLMDEDAVEN